MWSYRRWLRGQKKRKGSTVGGAGVVLALIVVAVTIVIGAVVFARSFATLDALRDGDFTAAANTTIAAVNTDFWSGLDLMRMLLIVIPAGAILGAIFVYMVGRR